MYLTVAFLFFHLGGRAIAETDEQRLLTQLFRNYDRTARPVSNSSKSVDVEVAFSISQLYSVDALRQQMTVLGWLELRWFDEVLHWNPTDFGGMETIYIPSNRVWIPSLSFDNSAGAIYNEDFYKLFSVRLDFEGNLNFDPGGKFTTLCNMDIDYYPFDQQSCSIKISGWNIPGDKVDLNPAYDEIDLSLFQESGEWEIVSTKCERSINLYTCCPQSQFPFIDIVVNLKRKSGFYILNIIIPCMILGLLDLFVFLVPAESGEKVAMGMTVLLAFSVFSLMVIEQIPKTSDGIPIIVKYLIFCMGMSATSVVLSVLITHVYYNRSTKRPPKIFIRHLVDKCEKLHQNNEIFDPESNAEENDNDKVTNEDENSRTATHEIQKHFVQIKKYMEKIEQRLGEERDKLQNIAEWKMITSRIENFCALVFTVVNILVPIGILYIIPKQQ